MAQHDYNIANQSGADFRADLNNALLAIATVNSGATEPSTTFAHQLWVDTSSSVLKIRNAADNAWITTGVSITASNTFTGNLTGNVTGNLTGNVTGNVTGDLTGNADTATTLATARTISLSGDVAGSASFDGSGDITISTTAQIDSIALGTDTTGDYVQSISGGTGVTITGGTGEGSTPSVAIGQAVATTSDVTFNIITATNEFIGDLEGGIRFNAKADGALSKGDVVYISGVSGDVPTVAQAKADDASKMPAFGLALSDANDNAALQVITFGTIEELDTSGVSEGQILYVSTTAGAYTTTAPTGESSQIQNIGKVIRSHAAAGSIKVGGAGRSNATPNLNNGKIFIGNGSNQSVTATLDTSIVVENTNLYYTTTRANTDFDTRLATKDTGDLTEGSNLYYTTARVNSDFDTRLATKSTTNLAEGTNLYYTTARFDSAFTSKDTDDLSEGLTNLYYTTARFDSAFGNKTTSNLTEGTNLYYTTTRANSAIDTRVTKAFVDALGIQATSVDANSVTLGTDTVGNYVATVTGTANKITVSGSGSESANITLSLPDDVQIADSLTVAGNLTVNGTLTSLDTTNLDIEDNLFQLNAGLTGSPVNDSGMLINRGNLDNGIFMWDESVDKFTLGLTTADGSATGNITLNSLGTLVANLEGNVTGNVTGNLTGTVLTAAQPNITSLGTLTGLTTTGNINFGDNDKAVFGAGSDLQIYHDGTHSYVSDQGTGSLFLQSSGTVFIQNSGGTANYFKGTDGGAAELFHNGSPKLATTSTGIDVTGEITADGLALGDGQKATFGASDDLRVYHSSSQSYIEDAGAGNLNFKSNGLGFDFKDGSDNLVFQIDLDSETTLYHNTSSKLTTTSTGIDVTGTATMDGLTVDGSALLKANTATLQWRSADGTSNGYNIKANISNTNDFGLIFEDKDQKDLLKIQSNGDISFYEDTGTTAKMTWDASADALTFTDNTKAVFGAGSDLQIYHDGSNSYIKDGGTGDLRIWADNPNIATAAGNKIFFGNNGAAQLYYTGGALRLATTSTGIDVTGTATMDGLTVDGIIALTDSGSSNRNILYLDGSDNVVLATGTTAGARGIDLYTNNNKSLSVAESGDISFYEDTGTTAKFFWDASAESLGIGTTSPATGLDVRTTNYTYSGTNYDIYGIIGLTNGGVRLGGDSTNADSVIGTTGAGNMQFVTYNGSAWGSRMTLTNSGSLLTGKTSADFGSTQGFEVRTTGNTYITAPNVQALRLTRTGSDGDIAVFKRDSTTVGSIGALSGDLYLDTSGGELSIRINGTTKYEFDSSQFYSKTDAQTSLGVASNRFNNLYLSGGVYLGGTGAANKLDDYEEGTWTPDYDTTNSDLANFSIFSGALAGKYTKVGNQVTVYGCIATFNAASISGTGYIVITGLPFSAVGNANGEYKCVALTSDNRFTNNPSFGLLSNGTTTLKLYKTSAINAANQMAVGDMNATNTANFNLMSFVITYMTS